MAQTKVVRTRRRRRSKVEEPVEEVEVEEVEQEDEEDEDEEEVDEQPTRRRRRRRISKTEEPEDEDDEDDEPTLEPEDDEEEEEVEERPRRRARKVDEKSNKQKGRRGDRIKTDEEMAAAEAEPDPEPVSRLPKSVEVLMKDAFITDILDVLEDGQTLLITRRNKDTWEMRTKHQAGKLLVAEEEDFGPRLSGKEYYDEVLSQEYVDFYKGWNEKTYEERKAFAEENKIEWEEHESEKISKMRLGVAVLDHLGIEKYKEKYQSQSARRAIRA